MGAERRSKEKGKCLQRGLDICGAGLGAKASGRNIHTDTHAHMHMPITHTHTHMPITHTHISVYAHIRTHV